MQEEKNTEVVYSEDILNDAVEQLENANQTLQNLKEMDANIHVEALRWIIPEVLGKLKSYKEMLSVDMAVQKPYEEVNWDDEIAETEGQAEVLPTEEQPVETNTNQSPVETSSEVDPAAWTLEG